MLIGYLCCTGCEYKSEEFMCTWHFWRDGYHIAVQDRVTLAIRLIHVPDDEVFYATSDELKEDRNQTIDRFIASILAKNLSEAEREIPIMALLRGDRVHVPCPKCRASIVWQTTGIT
jgi:hypothetical protein